MNTYRSPAIILSDGVALPSASTAYSTAGEVGELGNSNIAWIQLYAQTDIVLATDKDTKFELISGTDEISSSYSSPVLGDSGSIYLLYHDTSSNGVTLNSGSLIGQAGINSDLLGDDTYVAVKYITDDDLSSYKIDAVITAKS